MRALGLCAVALTLSACSFDHSARVLPDNGEGNDDGTGEPGQPDAATVDGGTPDAAPPPMEPAYTFRINVGGPEFVGTEFPGTWQADDGSLCDGGTDSTGSDIRNTSDDALFQSVRYGSVDCSIGDGGLAAGDYIITLYFGEIYRGTGCRNPGSQSRVYDVEIEGDTVLDQFDVVSEGGGCVASTSQSSPAPFSRQFTKTVSDGTLRIRTTGDNNGSLSAIEVVSVATVPVTE